jgi:hypothetical protein
LQPRCADEHRTSADALHCSCLDQLMCQTSADVVPALIN